MHNTWRFPFGDMNGVAWSIHLKDAVQTAYEKFKGRDKLFGFYAFLEVVVMPTDLDLIKDILIKDFHVFSERGTFYNEVDDPLSAHLFSMDPDKWKFIRNKISPGFTSGKIKSMYQVFEKRGEHLIGAVRMRYEKGPIEMRDLISRFVCDVIGDSAFGIECGTLKNEKAEIMDIAEKLTSVEGMRMFQIFFLECFQKTSRALHLRLVEKSIETYVTKVVTDTIKYREENNLKINDFLNLLIQLMETNSEGDDTRHLTLEEIISQTFIFFFASFETTSTVLTFAFYELCVNTEVQERTRKEILDTVKNFNGELSYDALKEMTFLTQVVNG